MLGVVPMLVLGAVALISMEVSDSRTSGMVGLLGGVAAAPGLLVVGAPFGDDARYPIAVLLSVPLWLALGLLASRRATVRSLASWSDYWRELLWLTIAVIAGAAIALIAAASILGESLIT